MKKLSVMFLIFFISACANIKDTVVPPADLHLRDGIAGKVIYTEGCTYDDAYLKVTHYQGLFRIPQPSFIGGFPKSERDSMLRLSVQTAAFAFFQQLQDTGAAVRLYSANITPETGSIRLMCSIRKIKIGIYDNGFGGFGSAGDFWEAETDFDLKAYKDGREYVLNTVTGKGQVKHAPISPGSFFDVLILSAKIAASAVNGSMFGVAKEGFIDYKIDRNAKTPVEPAARIAASEAAKILSALK